MKTRGPYSWFSLLAAALLGFNGLGALYGGGLLILDPGGGKLGMPLSLLAPSPFSDYFWPGLILFVFNGLSSLLICLAVMMKVRQAPLLVLFQGLILCGWLLIQVAMLQLFNVLHIIMGITGIMLIGCGWGMNKLKN